MYEFAMRASVLDTTFIPTVPRCSQWCASVSDATSNPLFLAHSGTCLHNSYVNCLYLYVWGWLNTGVVIALIIIGRHMATQHQPHMQRQQAVAVVAAVVRSPH